MKYTIYKLNFKKGIRIGKNKLSETKTTFTADLIFSGILNEISKYDEKLLEQVVESTKNGELLFSDSFPFIKDELMLPKPMISIGNEDGDSKEKKKYKRIDFIPLSLWDQFLEGKTDPDKIIKYNERIGSKQLDTKIEYQETGKHNIYNMEYFRFNKDSGLYFILGYKDEDLYYEIDESLYNLSFTGIGGKKSIGLGRFEMINEDLPKELNNIINTKKSNMLITTSMAGEDELENVLNNNSSYSLSRKGGYTYSESKKGRSEDDYKKDTLYFFNSGSIFDERFEGELFRIDNGFIHPIYRYAKPLWLEVKK